MRALLLVALSAHVAAGQTHALVSVGEHRLDVVRAGAGGPVVVFETGLADSLDVWLPMLRTMSEYTTVIAYSRTGFGRSDAGSPDHSVPHAAADLHELLHRLPVKPAYIPVARSYGSLIARLYTSLYPADPDIPIGTLTSMRSDESAPYLNGTARGHEVWRALHDEWLRRSRNGIHIETTRSGHGIRTMSPSWWPWRSASYSTACARSRRRR